MNPFKKLWFWLMILSIIGFIIAFVLFERYGQTNTTNTSTPGWVWVVFVVAAILWIIALILYIIDLANYYREMEIAEACGELPPPPPKKKIECPKKECVEKKVVECVERKPCNKKVVVETEEPAVPKIIGVAPSEEDAFSAATLKPLSSLAPPSENI